MIPEYHGLLAKEVRWRPRHQGLSLRLFFGYVTESQIPSTGGADALPGCCDQGTGCSDQFASGVLPAPPRGQPPVL